MPLVLTDVADGVATLTLEEGRFERVSQGADGIGEDVVEHVRHAG